MAHQFCITSSLSWSPASAKQRKVTCAPFGRQIAGGPTLCPRVPDDKTLVVPNRAKKVHMPPMPCHILHVKRRAQISNSCQRLIIGPPGKINAIEALDGHAVSCQKGSGVFCIGRKKYLPGALLLIKAEERSTYLNDAHMVLVLGLLFHDLHQKNGFEDVLPLRQDGLTDTPPLSQRQAFYTLP